MNKKVRNTWSCIYYRSNLCYQHDEHRETKGMHYEQNANSDVLTIPIILFHSLPIWEERLSSFFFFHKMDGSLRPCKDCWGLNKIMVKNKYPLPLLEAAFSPLHKARFFTKLDLRNVVWTYHKKVTYLQSAKQLNSWQVRWAFFLSCF